MKTAIVQAGFVITCLLILIPELRSLTKNILKLVYAVLMWSASYLILVAKQGREVVSPAKATAKLVALQERHKIEQSKPKDESEDSSETLSSETTVAVVRRPTQDVRASEEKRKPVEIDHDRL